MKRLLALVGLVVLFVLPLAVVGLYAVSGRWEFPSLLPTSYSVRAFAVLMSQAGDLLAGMGVSILYSLATVALSLTLCIVPASVFAWERFPTKAALNALLLAPAVVPAITFAMGAHFLLIILGLTDNIVGVILVLTTFSYPYMLRALTNGFASYSRDYEVCAANLGAGLLRRSLRVHLPMLMPSVIAGSTMVFLIALSEYFLVFLIGGGVVPSYTGFLFPFLNGADRPVASALVLLFLVIPISLFALIDLTVSRRYRKRGMA